MTNPPAARKAELESTDEADHRRALTMIARARWRTKTNLPPVSDDEIGKLLTGPNQLSAEPLKALAAAKTKDDRIELIHEWIRAIYPTRPGGGFGRQGMGPTDKELARFVEQDLSADERENLLSLPAEEMPREERRLYFEYQRKHAGGSPPGTGPHGPGKTNPEAERSKPDASPPGKSTGPNSGAKPNKGAKPGAGENPSKGTGGKSGNPAEPSKPAPAS